MDIQTSSWSAALVWLGFLFLIGVVLYIYFAVTLMMIARKTNTPGAELAWIPILNLYLMCKIGRRPAWWMLLCFVPFVNLFALAMIWMSIAETSGKPVWTGALAIIPFAGLVVPAYLAFGASSTPTMRLGARNCPSCGNPIIGDETFCRDCGESAATVLATRAATPIGQMALISGPTSAAVLLLFGVFGWFTFATAFSYSPPERKPPAMSERTAGTLTEFPVDTDTTAPLAPESVVAEDLQNAPKSGSTTVSDNQTAKRLPPGVNRENLKQRGATTLTTTVYRRRPKTAQPSTPIASGGEIYICVLRITPGQADSIAIEIVRATGGSRSGTRLQSPRGGTYIGSKIQTTQILIYVLEKQGADTLILIYSPNPAMNDAAIRLAGNVGNGEGLSDYPETQNAIWTLPQQKPADLVLVDFSTVTRAEMGFAQSDSSNAGTIDDKNNNDVSSRTSSFVGCYKDTSAFDLNGFIERSRSNTPQRCTEICRSKGFKYAGVQYSESCLCGNTYGKYGAADNCNMKCTGDSSQICGGYSSNGIYTTGFTANDIQVKDNRDKVKNPETQELFEYISQFIPERATHARYQDAARRDWEVMIYDYDSPNRAWNTWFLLSWTVGLNGQSVSLKHGGGIYADTDDGRALIFRKGPYLIFILAPAQTNADKIISFGDGFQV
jgi:hypothetical protein